MGMLQELPSRSLGLTSGGEAMERIGPTGAWQQGSSRITLPEHRRPSNEPAAGAKRPRRREGLAQPSETVGRDARNGVFLSRKSGSQSASGLAGNSASGPVAWRLSLSDRLKDAVPLPPFVHGSLGNSCPSWQALQTVTHCHGSATIPPARCHPPPVASVCDEQAREVVDATVRDDGPGRCPGKRDCCGGPTGRGCAGEHPAACPGRGSDASGAV